MDWKIITKDPSHLAIERFYRDCKEDLSKEAEHSCVYCCIHESRFGGIRNFHVEHYKPKSKYKTLTNKYSNLFYSCSICNCFKGNDWPNEPDEIYEIPFYPNPLVVNYSDFIEVDLESGMVKGMKKTTKYLIEKLYLNRPQLVNERKFFGLMKRMKMNLEILKEVEKKIVTISPEEKLKIFDTFIKVSETHRELSELAGKLHTISPYTITQVSK
jgi:hypothetical protein